jgi:hypothetical protein
MAKKENTIHKHLTETIVLKICRMFLKNKSHLDIEQQREIYFDLGSLEIVVFLNKTLSFFDSLHLNDSPNRIELPADHGNGIW